MHQQDETKTGFICWSAQQGSKGKEKQQVGNQLKIFIFNFINFFSQILIAYSLLVATSMANAT